jgi:erythromycin esterase-like protein
MGGELRARYKDNYLPIGTTLYQGTLRTYDYPKTATQQISAPDPSTYNYDLGQADLPLYMLDLRKIPPGPVSDWAHRPTTTLLLYGQGGEDLSTICLLGQWFDVILHVQHTTPSKPL